MPQRATAQRLEFRDEAIEIVPGDCRVDLVITYAQYAALAEGRVLPDLQQRIAAQLEPMGKLAMSLE